MLAISIGHGISDAVVRLSDITYEFTQLHVFTRVGEYDVFCITCVSNDTSTPRKHRLFLESIQYDSTASEEALAWQRSTFGESGRTSLSYCCRLIFVKCIYERRDTPSFATFISVERLVLSNSLLSFYINFLCLAQQPIMQLKSFTFLLLALPQMILSLPVLSEAPAAVLETRQFWSKRSDVQARQFWTTSGSGPGDK